MEPLEIRQALPTDLDAVVDIYLALAEHHAAFAPGRYQVPDRDAVRSRFVGILHDADNLPSRRRGRRTGGGPPGRLG